MCGIAGYFRHDGTPDAEAARRLRAMAHSLAHRGPDGEGVVLFPVGTAGSDESMATSCHAWGGFAHRRLSILDLSAAANQPFPDASGRYWLCYNGEVYNYLELRRELETAGYRFRTTSDTEVVLTAYLAWGERCLQRFNGMWALAVWDSRERRLWLARDRFGVKPLYIAGNGAWFAFASEISALLALPEITATPNDLAVADFLCHGRVDCFDFSFFQGVSAVPAGSTVTLEWRDDRPWQAVPRPWWSLDQAVSQARVAPTFEQNAELLRELFVDAVRIRLRSDVPVGTCLSGGLDSSAVVCAAAPWLQPPNQNSFSAVYPGFAKDESRWVDLVVNQTGIVPHTVTPTAELLKQEFPALLRHQEQPFGSTSIFAQWKVFELARQRGVPVTLDGQGADETLAGYDYFFPVYYWQLLGSGRAPDWWRETRARARLSGGSALWERLSTAGGPWDHRRMIRLAGLVDPGYATGWVDPALRRRARELPTAQPVLAHGERLNQRLADVFTRNGLPALLRYADRNAMAFSVESRMPFMDYRLVSFLLALPADQKIREGQTKAVLRQAVRGHVPDAIVDRQDKIGFETPETDWFRSTFQPELATLLDGGQPLAIEPWIRRNRVAALWRTQVSGKQNVSRSLWRLYCLEQWMQEFILKARGTP